MDSNKLFLAAQKAHQEGKFTIALYRYQDLVRAFPGHVDGLNLLGVLYSQMGEHEKGAEVLQKVIELAPNNPVAWTNLGEVQNRAGHISEAIRSLEKATEIEPGMAQAHFNLANILKQKNELDAAIERYKTALTTQPQYAEAWFNLGNTYLECGLFRSASKAYESAIALQPNHADARMNLGIAYSELGEVQKAVNRYKDALEIKPNSVEMHRNLGYALSKQGEIPAAIESFQKALALDPENELFRLHIDTLCPPVLESHRALDAYRQQLTRTLDLLSDTDLSLDDRASNGEAYFPSLIAYQGQNDLQLKKQWAFLFERHFESLRQKEFPPRDTSKPIKVGFVVTHGHEGVFLKCMRGIINRLPGQGNFEVVIVCSQQAGVEILQAGITNPEISYLPLRSDLEPAAEAVRAAQFDILHFWEIGTDSMNYFLPFYRLAPVQCATWGWPVTSGIRQVDYFISCELLETDNSAEFYSEELVNFERLPVYYHPPPVPNDPQPRAVFGLGSRDHIYLCTQNLRKVHPDMDRLIEGILEGDPQGRVIFIQDAQPGITDLLRKRFQQEIPEVANRIQFLPRLPEKDYLNVVMLADVVIDTLHYCGGANTTYDAFAAGTPIVTLPMRYHRGRYTAAAYRQMGMTELIADSAQDYIRLALALGTNPEYRAKMSAEIQEKAAVLFEDEQAVVELARFFEKVTG